jgi:hypothetical protein
MHGHDSSGVVAAITEDLGSIEDWIAGEVKEQPSLQIGQDHGHGERGLTRWFVSGAFPACSPAWTVTIEYRDSMPGVCVVKITAVETGDIRDRLERAPGILGEHGVQFHAERDVTHAIDLDSLVEQFEAGESEDVPDIEDRTQTTSWGAETLLWTRRLAVGLLRGAVSRLAAAMRDFEATRRIEAEQ